MAKPSGLGKGLGALLGDEYTRAASSTASTLPISQIENYAGQPRKYFDEESLAELAESIAEHGVIQPLTVRKLSSGYYQIIAGERRWRAARMAGLKEVPVVVIEADDRTAMELAMVENLQREDLNPMEEAEGYKALMDQYGMTQEQAAGRVGKSRSAVANALRLLNLSPAVRKLVEENKLSFHQLFITKPQVFMRADHPLAQKASVGVGDLITYPRLNYVHSSEEALHFASELFSDLSTEKSIEVSDTGTIVNLMLGTEAYYISNGFFPRYLKGDKIVAVPLDEDELMAIGYILSDKQELSEQGKAYIEKLRDYGAAYGEAVEE